jgi:hypothetical protein
MNTKKAATNKNSFSFEESARRENVDFFFCGIHTFKFIDHSNQAGKDLTPPSPTRGMEAVGPSEIGVAPMVGASDEQEWSIGVCPMRSSCFKGQVKERSKPKRI